MKRNDWILVASAIFVLLSWIGNWVYVQSNYCGDNQGIFGDMFGATTSLFSGLTIIGLIYTILQQREEIKIGHDSLKTQLQELELNRKEIQLNREEFKSQNRTLKWQRFDNTFFNLLGLHNQIILNTPWKQAAFTAYMRDKISQLGGNNLEKVQTAYREMLDYTTLHFSQYIGNFEFIVNFIFERKKRESNQDMYLKLYFAQLTIPEKIFLYYYYNLTEKPKSWDRIKGILFQGLSSTHLSNGSHASFLEGIISN